MKTGVNFTQMLTSFDYVQFERLSLRPYYFALSRSRFATASASFFRVPGCTRSPRRKRSIACCEVPDLRLSNFFGKRLARCINAVSAGRVLAVLRGVYLTGPTFI